MKRLYNPNPEFCLRSFLLCFLAAGLLAYVSQADDREVSAFSIPEEAHEFSFPADHGSHPDFKIEWWYLTGHLFAGEKKERFGFQATFFRLGQKPVDVASGEKFGESQIYMAHMALTDVEGKRFLHEERFNRGGWDAFSTVGKLGLQNGNWSLSGPVSQMKLEGSIRSDATFSLLLEPAKPLVMFGENGVSRKGAEKSAASYYLTFPRLKANGKLQYGERELEVSGEVWMDHEISSSQLDRNQIGWDWVSIQLFDGREVMAYILRNEDGSISPFSKLVWIAADGKLTHQSPGEFLWKPGGVWESKETGAVYPVSPSIETKDPNTGKPVNFQIRPVILSQEMVGGAGGVNYWEGACDVLDDTEKPVGRAYLELTGYSGDLAHRLR